MSRLCTVGPHSESDTPERRLRDGLQWGRSTGAGPSVRPLVSVLTPTTLRPQRISFLEQVHVDLCVSDVDWEWIIAVDGTRSRCLPPALLADSRVHGFHVGHHVGTATSRNLALGLARGAYVTSVDDDDRLPAGSLESRVTAATEHAVGWVAGLLADLHDGELSVCRSPVPPGRNEAGSVWRAWGCPCLDFPIGPTTLLVEAGLLRSVGGWHGLPQAEDLGMTLAVTGRAAGVMLDQVVYAYRKHLGQMTAQADFAYLEPLVRHIAYERGRLLASPDGADEPTECTEPSECPEYVRRTSPCAPGTRVEHPDLHAAHHVSPM